jgi:hypothetical protein
MGALAIVHDASVQMIDTSIVRVHQHGASIARDRSQSMGWLPGGLTSKIHAVDTNPASSPWPDSWRSARITGLPAVFSLT